MTVPAGHRPFSFGGIPTWMMMLIGFMMAVLANGSVKIHVHHTPVVASLSDVEVLSTSPESSDWQDPEMDLVWAEVIAALGAAAAKPVANAVRWEDVFNM